MLVITRRLDESIVIDGNITITILEAGNSVRLGIEAHRSIDIHCAEVYQRIVGENPEQAPTYEPDTVAMAE